MFVMAAAPAISVAAASVLPILALDHRPNHRDALTAARFAVVMAINLGRRPRPAFVDGGADGSFIQSMAKADIHAGILAMTGLTVGMMRQ
jgi:hypothetical protein